MTKKRYTEIHNALMSQFSDAELVKRISDTICNTLGFDPEANTYNEARHQATTRYRQKLKELGKCCNYYCESVGHAKYNNYCIRCFVHLFPDSQVVKYHKTKEVTVVTYLREQFPALQMTLDKRIEGGCSRYRPDIFTECLTHSVIIEVDENQHDTYDCTCENKRMMQVFQDLGNRPLVLIRFNPDAYFNNNERKIKSCFIYSEKLGLPRVNTKYKEQWEHRLSTLKAHVQDAITHIPDREVTVHYLFYDGWCE